MNNRIKNDLRILNEYLTADIEYRHEKKGNKHIYTFVLTGMLGETKLPKYQIPIILDDWVEMSDEFDDRVEGMKDLAMGHYATALANLIRSDEASPERDMLNAGLRDVTMHEVDGKREKVIKKFKNQDQKAQINLLDNVFKHIKVEPDFENTTLKLYYTNNGNDTFISEVGKDSNAVAIATKYLDITGNEMPETVVLAVKNQIREFRDLFRDELVDKQKAEQAKIEKERGKFNGKKG